MIIGLDDEIVIAIVSMGSYERAGKIFFYSD